GGQRALVAWFRRDAVERRRQTVLARGLARTRFAIPGEALPFAFDPGQLGAGRCERARGLVARQAQRFLVRLPMEQGAARARYRFARLHGGEPGGFDRARDVVLGAEILMLLRDPPRLAVEPCQARLG